MHRVKNPLVDIPKTELFKAVERYAEAHNLSEITPILKKGALAAQNPNYPETIQELDSEDVRALQEEKTHRWRHPKMLYFLIILNSIGAAIQGWYVFRRRYMCDRVLTFPQGSNGQ